MNSFERFGITHLSPSSLNLWNSSPGLWAYRYIARVSDRGNARMWQGSAVGVGLGALLRDKDIGYAIALARESYDMNAAGEISDEIEAERELIDVMLRRAMHWAPPGMLNAVELKVEHWFEGIPVPIIGYIDMAFPGVDIDLKCTKRLPSVPRYDHVRQVSLYRAARGRQGGLLYLSSKNHEYYVVDDDAMEVALADMRADALALSNQLARCETKADVLKSLPIDWSHYRAPKVRMSLDEMLLQSALQNLNPKGA